MQHGPEPTTNTIQTASLVLPLLGTIQAGLPLSQQQQPVPVPAPIQTAGKPLSTQQLEDPGDFIELYPDNLLSELRVASTYPLEAIEAEQWAQKNGRLSDKRLMDETQNQSGYPSMQAVVVLSGGSARLNQNMPWTADVRPELRHEYQAPDTVPDESYPRISTLPSALCASYWLDRL